MRSSPSGLLLDGNCPINWDHPLNTGLVGEWAVTPIPGWYGGNTLRDLVRGAKTPHNGAFNDFPSGYGWNENSHSGGFGSIRYDGTTFQQLIDVPYASSLSPTGELTVGGWVLFNSFSGSQRLLSKTESGGWNIAVGDYATNYLSFVCNINSGYVYAYYDCSSLATNRWYHVLGVYQDSSVSLFINGLSVFTTSAVGPITYSNINDLIIGNEAGISGIGSSNTGGSPLNGCLDDVVLYNIGLSPAQVAALYQEMCQGNPNRWNWLSRTAWVVSPGGGTTYSRSIADNLAGNDVTQRLVSSFRTLADYPALIDVLSKQTSSYRSLSDSLGLYSTVIQNITYSRIASDNLGVHDTLSSLVSSLRYLADNLAIDDTSERIVDSLRNVADSLALYDSTSRKGVSNRIINDNLGFSDTFSRLVASYRFLSDSLALYDTLSTQQIHPGVLVLKIIDNLGVNDTLSRQVRLFRLLSDYLGENDTLTLKTSSKRVVNDNLGINDSLIRSQVFVRLLQDYLGESDKSQRIILSLRKLADNLTLFDSVTASIGLGLRILIQDNIGFNDFLSRVATGLRYIADFLAVNDSILRQATNLRTLADNLGSNDQTSRLVNAYRTLTDNLGLSDSLIAELIPYVIVTRIISLTGSLTNRNLTGSSPSRNLTGD